jgi:hypothetical protein
MSDKLLPYNGDHYCSGDPDCYMCRVMELEAEVEALREGIRESYEVYAGMDGFKPETCSEGYCLRIIDEMAAPLAKMMESKPCGKLFPGSRKPHG